jgi:5-methylcytosine-specific restriction protein B
LWGEWYDVKKQKGIALILYDMGRDTQELCQMREKMLRVKEGMMWELLTGKNKINMKRGYSADVQSLFDEFAQQLILNKKSFLTSDDRTIDAPAIDKCFNKYGVDGIEGNRSFDSKINDQFDDSDIDARIVLAHAQWLWAYSARDKTLQRKKEYTMNLLKGMDKDVIRDDVYTRGFGSTGQWHNQNKYWEILFNLILIKLLNQKVNNGEIDTLSLIKNYVESYCLKYKYGSYEEGDLPESVREYMPTNQIATANILLYIVNPEKYEPIASNNHKNKIVSSFQTLLDDERSEVDLNTDEKIFKIRKAITKHTGDIGFDYYKPKLKKIWNYGSLENDFTEIQGLEYKKAIILYGPPGTSKTYSAFQIAEALITKNYLKDKNNIESFLNDQSDDQVPIYIRNRVHRLQLHQNYSYEDFIAGIRLVNGNTKPEKGYLFDVIEKAEKDDYPHVLLLDEINRVDLSQLFGEVFSAIENRGEEVDLSIGNFSLKIPQNLYIIGTMNEIDFSLERIDFALRRRFLWYSYPFSKDKLREILEVKFDKDPSPENLERFVDNAEALNAELIKVPTLGKRYQIGHTFFAEIADIYKTYLEINNKTRLQDKFYRSNGPADILWDISIAPMIRSFLGSMSEEDVKDQLEKLKTVFFK